MNVDDLIHPGEILSEEFLGPLAIGQTQLAADLGVPFRRINEIVRGRRSITAETALLLATYFGNSPEFWMNLQVHHDLERSALTLKKVDSRTPVVDQGRGVGRARSGKRESLTFQVRGTSLPEGLHGSHGR